MKAISHQLSAFSKNVSTQERTRENIMLSNHKNTLFPLSLDGRGVRGEGILAAALFALATLFAPQAAQAQCVPPTGTEAAPVPASGTVTCQPGDYVDGIYYDSAGDLTLEVPDDTVDLNVFEDGVNVTGNGADNIFWDSEGFTSGEITGTGILIDYSSDAGNIDILTGGIVKGADDATHAIRAESTGGGSVSVTTMDNVNVRAGFSGPDPSGTGIEALTTTGDISIDAQASVEAGRAGGQYAIHAGSSAGGNIDIQTGSSLIQGRDAATHAILAETTGAGAITINTGGSIRNSGSSGTGIEAVTNGDGNVTITSTGGNVSGWDFGIKAATGGAGEITVTHDDRISGGISFGSPPQDVVALDLTAGTGKVTVNSVGLNAGLGFNIDSTLFAGTVLRADYDGDAEFNLNMAGSNPGLTSTHWVVDLSTQTGTSTQIGVAEGLGGTVFNFLTRALRVQGGADVSLDVAGTMGGRLNLAGGGAVDIALHSGGAWFTDGASVFGPADDVVTVDADSRLVMSGSGRFDYGDFLGLPNFGGTYSGSLDFGDGDDTLSNAGTIAVGSRSAMDYELLNLETFENSGVILMGGGNEGTIENGLDRNFWGLLSLPGVDFVASEGSVLMVDVDLVGSQSACDPSIRGPVTRSGPELPAADCMRIEGGTTSGVTQVLIQEFVQGDRGGLNEIVLVDMAGGTSQTGHFVLHPDSDNYNPDNGGYIDKGFFIYPLVFDPATQQHKLAGGAGGDAQQLTLLPQAAHELWRLSSGSYFDRQSDRRGEFESGIGGSAWLKVARESIDRYVVQQPEIAGNLFTFDNSYSQESLAVNAGVDMLSGGDGDTAYVFGATVGYLNSDVDSDHTPNSTQFDGWSAGLYASFLSGGFFIDGIVNMNDLIMKTDIPALDLSPEDTIVHTDMRSYGAQVEAGWIWPVMDGVTVEPIAGLSYVQSNYEDLVIKSADPVREPIVVEFDDPTSLRGSLGGRITLDQDLGAWRAQYSLLGRFWNEFEDETRVIGHNPSRPAVMTNDFGETFSELQGGITLSDRDRNVEVFLNGGYRFNSDYDAMTFSAGGRVRF